MVRSSKISSVKQVFMKTLLLILFYMFCVESKSQSQSSGYVLWKSDGSVLLPSGTLALSNGSITLSGSIGVTGTRVTKIWSVDGEFTNMPTVGGTSLSSTFQASNAKLTAIAALANASGFLKNDGAGNFSYDNPAGSGTVTNTGTLTSNAVVLGNGGADTKVVSGVTTNGTAQLVLGVNTTTLGSVKMFGNTSGDATIQPAAVAGTATVLTLPITSGTLMLNTATSGVAATPTASGTTTVTHNLGRIPTIIRIYGLGGFTNNNSGVPTSQSQGRWTSSGNTCLFQRYDATAVTGAEPSETSTAFAIFVGTSNGNFVSGVIQNVTSTGFDIVWTETGTAVAQNYLWEAQ